MLRSLLGKVVGDSNEREIRKLQPLVDQINGLETQMERRSDAELGALTARFRGRLASGATLDDILVEAFAAIREVAKRTVDMRPFDVQLVGGIILHQGTVAEMRTGEGKTLVATMPVYLNALLGRGVHLVTVNDYLARRDALWMGPIYHRMGLSLGLLQSGADQPAYLYDPLYQRDPYPGLRPVARRQAYRADITYGTNNEFGFDYLRDNLALTLDRRVQRPLYYAIVDEVDNIFIDEARTPLIISGPSDEPVEEYSRFAAIARKLEPDIHYELDEKERSVYLTDDGLALVEQETGIENIYDEANYRFVHYMQQALKAQVLYLDGRDYIRQRKKIILIDQHTGRLMPSRRLSEGLHQAIEAKENVPVRRRDITSATVTIQNYFRMYEKLAGMSGTAVTESEEFFKIYGLDVLAVPTNKPVVRADHPDVVYRSEEAKFRAVSRAILACHSQSQPVLVGTTSVEMSERLSKRLAGERLQMACLAPRIAYAMQETDLTREERSQLREVMNSSLETVNPAAWNRLMRTMGLDHNALSVDNISWITDYLDLPTDPHAQRTLEQALREGIPHQILNAKEHTREAATIARAGEPGSVTIATNMAGRGVDIKLGGELSDEVIHRAHQSLEARGLDPFSATAGQTDSAIAEVAPEYARRRDRVLAAGGLHVLGTERHEARRIDNQLRGRSGRQGEPGSSRFYLSLEDDLMRRFGRREMLSKLMEQIGDDFPIEHGLVSRTIERAQTSVEGYNFDIRKHLLEYDDVVNRQRESIYGERLRILQSDDLRSEVRQMLERQVDEYVDQHGQEPDRRRLLFAGLDGIAQLVLVAPKSQFQGPLAFAGHLTAYAPFSVSFLSDQLAEQELETVRQTLHSLVRQAFASQGEQIRQTVSEVAEATLDKYDERLERYRVLLQEKIDNFAELAAERGQPVDPRRLAQHMERTFPLRLSTPQSGGPWHEDELRDFWLSEIEIEFHRQTCLGLLDRILMRVPPDIHLDRVRPARIPSDQVAETLRRLVDSAAKQAADETSRKRLVGLTLPENPTAAQVQQLIASIKENSRLDFGRLDRLAGHALAVDLDSLLVNYQEAADGEDSRLRRSLDRLRGYVADDRRSGRTDLLSILRELNDLVHLEIADVEGLASQAVAHEYDKWAQRQLTEADAAVENSPLLDTSWASIAEHLLAAHYTQKQSYDKDHRRRTAWMPRVPFSVMAQAHVADMQQASLREAILDSLYWAISLREQIWGQQELRRWSHVKLSELAGAEYDGLLRYAGEQELGEQRDQQVQELPPAIYDRLCFIVAVRQLGDRRLGELPHSERLVARLIRLWEEQVWTTPVGELDAELTDRIGEALGQSGYLDDPALRQALTEQPIRDWDRRLREAVAGFLGSQVIESSRDRPLEQLDSDVRKTVLAHLQKQQRFVDEAEVQRFLVHQRLTDLPPELQRSALHRYARWRLERMDRRKISNLDVSTRQAVLESLQRLGAFTDQERRDQFLASSSTLADLGEELRAGFGAFLARQQILGPGGEQSGDRGDAHLSLTDLEPRARDHVIQRLKETDLLANPERLYGIDSRPLGEVDRPAADQVIEDRLTLLRQDLASKTMEELPSEVRRLIHQELDELDYFVDSEKAGWYERRTLAQLPTELLLGMEQHLGQIRLSELATTPFRNLPAEMQDTLETVFDREGVLSQRADRLRLTQTGALGDLSGSDQALVAQHIGRHWLAEMRDQRPSSLPESSRLLVWGFLRNQGLFTDAFKEELFSYQRLDEFGAAVQQASAGALEAQLRSSLLTQPIGDLPDDIRQAAYARLRRADHFVDTELLSQVTESPVSLLTADLRQAVEVALGDFWLVDIDGKPIGEWDGETRETLLRYLDEVGHFVSQKKRSQILERRLADLSSDWYEPIVEDLASSLEAEIADQPVSELAEEVRQGLREALVHLGHFESHEERERVQSRKLGDLRREDLEALAIPLGQGKLDAWEESRLSDLPDADQLAIVSHLQTQDWFLDRSRWEELLLRPVESIVTEVGEGLMAELRSRQVEHVSQQRLADLSRAQRHAAHLLLKEQGLAADEGQMRTMRSKKLTELDAGVYRDLVSDLGSVVVDSWGSERIQDLGDKEKALLGAYLGRRIMSVIERRVLLYTISRLWVDYLTDIEDLRRGIGLEAYGQRDPLVEYKRRAYELFGELSENIRRIVVRSLFAQQPETLQAQQPGR